MAVLPFYYILPEQDNSNRGAVLFPIEIITVIRYNGTIAKLTAASLARGERGGTAGLKQQLRREAVLAIFLAFAAVYCLMAAAIPYVVSSLPTESFLHEHLLAGLEQELGVSVDFGEIRPAGLSQVEITDVTLAADGEVLARAKGIVVRADLARLLLTPWNPTMGISSVTMIEPKIALERLQDGTWDVASVLSNGSGSNAASFSIPLSVDIRVLDGTVAVKNWPRMGEQLSISQVNGRAKLTNDQMTAQVSGYNSLVTAGKITVDGQINLGSDGLPWQMLVRADDVGAASYDRSGIFSIPHLTLADGSADVTVGLKGLGGDLSEYSVMIDLFEVTGSFAQVPQPLERVKGKIVFDGYALALQNVTGTVGESQLSASGRISEFADPRLDLAISDLDVRLEDVQTLLADLGVEAALDESLKLAGQVQGDLEIAGKATYPTVDGEITVSSGTLRVPGLPGDLDRVSGAVRLESSELWVDLSTDFLGGKTDITGQIVSWSSPVLKLSLTSTLDAEQLTQWDLLPDSVRQGLGGDVQISASVEGPWQKPRVAGQVQVSALEWGEVEWGDAALKGSLFGTRLVVDQVSLSKGGGRVSGSGYLKIPESGTATELDYGVALSMERMEVTPEMVAGIGAVAKLPELEHKAKVGNVSGTVLVSGIGTKVDGLEGTGNLAMEGLQWQDAQFDELHAGLAFGAGKVSIDYLHLDGPTGSASAQGSVGLDGELDLVVESKELILAELGLVPGLSGEFSGAGEISGQLSALRVNGQAQVEAPAYGQYHADSVRSQILWEDGTLRLQDGVVQLGDGHMSFAGSVSPWDESSLEVSVGIDHIAADQLLVAMGQSFPVSGNVMGELELSGWVDSVHGSGKLAVSDLDVYGEQIQRVDTQIRLVDSVLFIDSLKGQTWDGEVTALGQIHPARGWNLEVEAQGLNLAESALIASKGYDAQGTLQAQAVVTGPLTAPILEGDFSGANVGTGVLGFDHMRGHALFAGDTVTFESVRLEKGSGEYLASGQVKLDSQSGVPDLDIKVQLDSTPVNAIAAWADIPEQLKLSGALDGYAHIWGKASAPTGRVILDLYDGSLLEASLGGSLDVTLQGSTVVVNRIRMEWGQGLVVGQGRLSSQEDLNFVLQGQDLQLQPLAGNFGIPVGVSGTVGWGLTLAGTAKQPQLDGTIDLAQAGYADLELSEGQARFALNGSRLDIEEIRVQAPGHVLHARGHTDLPLPFLAQLGVTGVKSGETAAIDIGVTVEPSSVERRRVTAFGAEMVNPHVEGKMQVSGSWQKPELAGLVSARADSLSHSLLADRAESLLAELKIDQGQIVVEALTAQVGRGQVRGAGKVQLAALHPQHYDLQLSVERVGFATDLLSGRIDGDVQVQGPADLPIISGDLKLGQGKAQLKIPQAGSMPLNAQLDLSVAASEDIAVTGLGIDMMLTGSTHIGGTLREPKLDGRLLVNRGSFNYLGTRFAVASGSLEFVPAQGILPLLDVRADGKLDEADVTLRLQGRVDQIETTLRSSLDIPEQELVARLGWPEKMQQAFKGGLWEDLDDEVVKMVEGELANQFLGDLTRTFQSALDLDRLQIQPSVVEQSVRVELGKYVVDDVFVTYSREVNESSVQEIGVEYRLNPNVVFETTLDGEGEKWFGFKGRFSF